MIMNGHLDMENLLKSTDNLVNVREDPDVLEAARKVAKSILEGPDLENEKMLNELDYDIWDLI